MAEKSKSASGLANLLLAVSIVGALNWGLIGLFNFNLVDALLGGGAREATSAASRVVYTLVGLCGLLAALMLPKMRFLKREPAGPAGGPRLGDRAEVLRP